MSVSRGAVIYGRERIEFSLLRVDRKTLEIAVHPDRTVVVKAPLGTNLGEVQRRVDRRADWIAKQQNFFRRFYPRTPPRRYVGGETHLYLGKHYRLKISCSDRDVVKLTRGFFEVEINGDTAPEKVKGILERWYRNRAAVRFQESLDRCWPFFLTFSPVKPVIQIKKMQKRWGSLSSNGRMTLNADLIRVPRECIDYVILHELSHLRYESHNSGFYRFLNRVMPDWERRKRILEATLA